MESGNTRAVKAGIGYTVGNILVKGIAFITIPLFILGITAPGNDCRGGKGAAG